MSEYIDYQAYKKHLLLTLSIDFIREDGIYQGVGISDVAGRTGRLSRSCRNGIWVWTTWMVFRDDEVGRAGTESGSGLRGGSFGMTEVFE